MKPESWQQIDSLFHSALEREPEHRAAFLDDARVGEEVRRQVEALLGAHEQAGSFIETPALDAEARELAIDNAGEKPLLTSGQTLGHYRIIEQLGAGGMGQVYLVEDQTLGRQIALKLLSSSFGTDQERLRRFQQEARAAAALKHPHIAQIYEIGEVGGKQFIAMEHVEGSTLNARIGGKPLRVPEIIQLGTQLADALDEAHSKGITHRDLKPSNIIVNKRGEAKLLDFGLAKITKSPADELANEATTRLKTAEGMLMGTVSYMSPEQALGQPIDHRSDIFSLGVVLYEMSTGRLPFTGSPTTEIIDRIAHAQPEAIARFNYDVPAEMERIIRKCLEKDKHRRYQSAREIYIDLKNLKRDTTIESLTSATFEHPRQHKTRYWLLAGAFLVVLLVLSGIYLFNHRNQPIDRATIQSIAVLPLVNSSGDAELDYLSDGISESLTNSLSQLPQLKVIAQSSVFKYKGKEIDPQEVASTLGVQSIVTGRIVQRGDNLQISVELIDTRDKTQVWGDQYSRKATDLIAVQSQIAREIASNLRLKLTVAQQQQLAKHETVNPEAYELLLKARFQSLMGGSENRKKTVEYLNQAIAIDRAYAPAYAELSSVYWTLAHDSFLDPKEGIPKAEEAARTALELDGSLAEAHLAMAEIKRSDWEWATAEREYKRAVELNQNLARAHHEYAVYLSLMGRHAEAIAEITRARELDPLSLIVNLGVGARLSFARRYDESINALKKTLELDQNFALAHIFLGYNYAAKGMYPEAIAAYQEFIKLSGDDTSVQISLGAAYASEGQRRKAQAILKRLQTTKEYVSPGELALLYAALGEREQAFASLERAYAAHDLQLQSLGVDPGFDPLRSDRRFHDLTRRVGLPE